MWLPVVGAARRPGRAVGRRVHRRLRRASRARSAATPAAVTSLIRSADADPHEYEPTPADALAVSRATVFVANGGGYDDFATKLSTRRATSRSSVVVTALSGFETDAPDFNEHVWYDLPTVKKLADHLATALGAADQPDANRYLDNAKKFDAQVDGLMTKVAAIKAKHAGVKVAITEPVPGYLLDAAGLVVVTPPEFSEAVEEGTDPPAAVVTANNATFAEAKVLVENAQTDGPDHHPGRAGRRGRTACPSSRSPRRCPKA